MSILGDQSTFAIQCEVSDLMYDPPQAHLRVWIGDKPVGDYEDVIILSASVSYLLDFLKFTGDRYEPDLDEKSKKEVFQLIFDSVIYTVPAGKTLSEIVANHNPSDHDIQPPYENIEKRFHLESFGMSSFLDKYNLILVETRNKKQRLIWRALSDMELHEILLEPMTFETVANQFLAWSEAVLCS